MLESVMAVRFDRRMKNGKTWPCLLACLRADGEECEVVAKFSAGCERGPGGLVAEAIAAMLAADLVLPVPEPVVVDFDAEFIDLLPAEEREMTARIRASVPVAFGSTKLPPGFISIPPDKAFPQSLRTEAAEIFAFDALIQNSDRRPENPNCLLDGHSFAIFDHEFAFMTEGIIGWQPPWKPGGLNSFKGTNRHVFFSALAGRPIDLSRFLGAWQSISDVRINEYRQALPPQWVYDKTVVDNCLDYISQVRDNIEPAIAEISRVLS